MTSMSSDARIVDGDQTPNTALQPSSRAGGLGLFECWLSRGSRLNVKPLDGLHEGRAVCWSSVARN